MKSKIKQCAEFILFFGFFAVMFFYLSSRESSKPVIKLSYSGNLCHKHSSPNYMTMKYYREFKTLKECLKHGDRIAHE